MYCILTSFALAICTPLKPKTTTYYKYLYNNLAKPFSTVCTDPFYGQTSGPRPPKFSRADPKLDVESRMPKKIETKNFTKKNSEIFLKFLFEFFFMKTRSVA
jgi:hypothetical protein